MTRRASIRQTDISRVVRGALAAGLPAGSFSIEVDASSGNVRLLPIAANSPSDDAAQDAERRMREAFGR